MERIKGFFATTVGKVVVGIIAALLVLMLVSSCMSRPTYVSGVAPYGQPVQTVPVAAAPAGQPVIVNNGGGGHHSGLGDAILGSAIGSYLGNRMAQPSGGTVTHQTITTTAPAQRYAPAPVQTNRPTAPVYRPSATTTTSTRSGYSTTTSTSSSGRTSISVGRSSSSSSRRR